MKYIRAIIRPEKFEEVRDALYNAGIEFFTYTDVAGLSFQKEQKYSYRGRAIFDSGTVNLKQIDIVLPDEDAEEIMEIINKAAQTGSVGDGKIFLWSLDKAERISK